MCVEGCRDRRSRAKSIAIVIHFKRTKFEELFRSHKILMSQWRGDGYTRGLARILGHTSWFGYTWCLSILNYWLNGSITDKHELTSIALATIPSSFHFEILWSFSHLYRYRSVKYSLGLSYNWNHIFTNFMAWFSVRI